MKRLNSLLALLALISILIAACGGSGNSNNVPTATPTNTVGLASATFAQSSITIKKGASITLVNQTSNVHIIANGTWQGNTPDPENEPGAPVVQNKTFTTQNQSLSIGPFNTTGTFHYYCSVHPDMSLSVIVQ